MGLATTAAAAHIHENVSSRRHRRLRTPKIHALSHIKSFDSHASHPFQLKSRFTKLYLPAAIACR